MREKFELDACFVWSTDSHVPIAWIECSILMHLRYPIRDSWLGGDEEPGNAYAVLYSLQKVTGRQCDHRTYRDTEVDRRFLIAAFLKRG